MSIEKSTPLFTLALCLLLAPATLAQNTGKLAVLGRLERVEFEEPRYELQERFLPFLIAGTALLLLGRLLQSTPALEVLP